MTAPDPADGPRTPPTGADASTRASALAGAPTSAPGASTEQQAADAVAAAWQQHWSRLIALVIGQYARPDLAEDAVSDAFESAARRWPLDGVPANTGAWLLTAARRRVLDRLRTESVQRRKAPLMVVDDEMRAAASAAVDPGAHVADEQLRLVFACCHPAIAPDDRVALTLRFVVGLSTAEIARLLLVQESAMAARLTRAKKRLAASGIPFATPPADRLDERLDVVATVVYLTFTSGYQPGAGDVPLRVDLGDEAIRQLRVLDGLLPDRAVVRALLALLLLQHSRRDTRLDADGGLVLLPDQDRTRWRHDDIDEALTLLSTLTPEVAPADRPAPTPADRPPAPTTRPPMSRLAREYLLQALIAAEHATAPTSEATRWHVVAARYAELERLTGSPVVRLARAVAVAEADGPDAGLRLLDGLDEALPRLHRVPAVRAELLARAGRRAAAAASYRHALTLVTNPTERTHLESRLAEVTSA
ncbi:sigma-70 family RNA polymerase sigma factor [Cellulomonas sp. H30R-01]|uniref:RNA polymerase sigma factor n=1 Tax=Cellulomonas sp. H30R-01 TaxID=2704467 RepID=UPI00138C4CDC|nr:sigma-70 family RNA polymerase sigma factor [Cellulomonas sp. H30R-01]QHT57785.1 sigma-70 family RNA polymerase sigma factor [Cellulomonas sp. H30R-01]